MILQILIVSATLETDDYQNDNEDRDRVEADEDTNWEANCFWNLWLSRGVRIWCWRGRRRGRRDILFLADTSNTIVSDALRVPIACHTLASP